MTRKDSQTATDRRGFLKFAGLGTVAGAVALVASPEGEAAEATTEKGLGYRETDHVRRVYESARF